MANINRTSFTGQKTGPLESGLGLLFLAAYPMILLLFQGSATSAFAAILQLGLFLLALRLIHRGQQVQREFDDATNAEAPRLPRKIIGATLIGVMVLIMAGHHFVSLLLPIGFAVLASGLTIAAYGIDPLHNKGEPETRHDPDLSQIREAAYADSNFAMDEAVIAIAQLHDAELSRQVEALTAGVQRLVDALSQDASEVRRLTKPVAKVVELLEKENAALLSAWDGESRARARRRYLARLSALGEAFEERARRTGIKSGRDAFELEADLLWTRMRQDRAA